MRPADRPRRPTNCWLLFRKEVAASNAKLTTAEVSRLASRLWHDGGPIFQESYKQLAREITIRHQLQFPGYKFQPKRKEGPRMPRRDKFREQDSRMGKDHRAPLQLDRHQLSPTGPGPQPSPWRFTSPPPPLLEGEALSMNDSEGFLGYANDKDWILEGGSTEAANPPEKDSLAFLIPEMTSQFANQGPCGKGWILKEGGAEDTGPFEENSLASFFSMTNPFAEQVGIGEGGYAEVENILNDHAPADDYLGPFVAEAALQLSLTEFSDPMTRVPSPSPGELDDLDTFMFGTQAPSLGVREYIDPFMFSTQVSADFEALFTSILMPEECPPPISRDSPELVSDLSSAFTDSVINFSEFPGTEESEISFDWPNGESWELEMYSDQKQDGIDW